MARQTIDRRTIAEAAYELAEREGLARLGIRRIAQACGVSVGTIYNYYPTKDDLMVDVISSFWRKAFEKDVCRIDPGVRFVDYLGLTFEAMRAALAAFRADWLPQIGALSMQGRDAGKMRETQTFEHMRAGMLAVLDADETADIERLVGIDAEQLVAYVLESMVSLLMVGVQDCTVLLALVRGALYADAADATTKT